MRVAILDYKAGNATSVQRAAASLGFDAEVTSQPEAVARADKVIFPGVGAAGSCMENLRSAGLDQALHDAARSGRPVLCVCIGMQLLFERSAEDGGVDCLGLCPGRVERFSLSDRSLKIPHMGWNAVEHSGDPLFDGISAGTRFYFVHSYHCLPAPGVPVIATSEHGGKFCAGVRRDNVAAVQFHPEKSGPAGLRLLRNFLTD
jgi:imidazole glycerol-phosphate synthase subunit HisH